MSIRFLAVLASLTLPLAAQAYTSAPVLDKLEKEGKLPPVAQRLPENPEVITPLEKAGKYGGTLRSALRGNGDGNAILRIVGNQGLVRWNIDMSKIVPNVAESWTTNADSSEYTFKLRRGMKWSDGSPFTADDVLFTMNDLLGNKGFVANPPSFFKVQDKPVVTEKVDDFTVRFKFAAPYVSFIEILAHPTLQYPTLYSKKYCSQYHPKYSSRVDELLKQNNAKDWGMLLRMKCGDQETPTRWANPERPTLDPWLIVEPYGGSAAKVRLKRNPYFWQVDSKGQQLPYIDELNLAVISEVETIVLAAINGQLDFQSRHIGGTPNLPVLSESAAKGGYKVLQMEDASSNSAGLFLNFSTRNEKLRSLIRNKDFRVALSLAMDRKEINEIIHLGQSLPWQIGPKKSNRFYNEQLATQYTKTDLKTANELLDKAGLSKRDAEGYRQYPSGGRVSIGALVPAASTGGIDTLDLVRKHWSKVGIELVIQPVERSLFYDRSNTNDYEMAIFVVGGGLDPQFDKTGVLAWSPTESRQSLLWVKWAQSGGKQGEEPSVSMKKRIELDEKWKVAKSQAEADGYLRQILQLAADEFEVIGTTATPRVLGVLSKRLVNVNEKMPWAWPYATPAGSLPQQWFFK
ncbi:ABC transporter substrate-binding protein [Uliginosibacterium sp. TH139]|uniref:ABC transporter substrate-binding protein n=1 Tax=Uliginosibacterium sp. TH139 TaxID=2067453 RepID=UPI000C7BAB96|nr:ABC transporter substrate-binding protein [Uliginosibacterium sp. TH139]PLK47094.1 peptide ABC transporter [Uliginosibacterium sp. TH139]